MKIIITETGKNRQKPSDEKQEKSSKNIKWPDYKTCMMGNYVKK